MPTRRGVVATALLLLLPPTAETMVTNGVAQTPPMGWLSWQRYRCDRNCTGQEDDCFSEKLVKRTADLIVSEGYKAAGYEYVNLDDCWQAPARVNGRVVADPVLFPSGIKALAAYVHSKGLKLGLYTAIGNGTCAMQSVDPTGFLGLGCDRYSLPACTRAKQDIEDFVSWDIDHLKVDGCQQFDSLHQNSSYAVVGRHLLEAAEKRGSPVVYHPSNLGTQFPRQFRELSAIGNQWRYFEDVQDNWESVEIIIEMIGAGQPTCLPGPLPPGCTGMLLGARAIHCASYCSEVEHFLAVPRPGGYHDPDMLLVGNSPCSATAAYPRPCPDNNPSCGMHCHQLTHPEEQTQMAIWAISAAPLFMSNDLRNVSAASKAILQNQGLLKIDQDPLGRMGRRFMHTVLPPAAGGAGVGVAADADGPPPPLPLESVQGWAKELANGDVAVALVNMAGEPRTVELDLTLIGFSDVSAVGIHDVWNNASLGTHVRTFTSAEIPKHGTALLRIQWI